MTRYLSNAHSIILPVLAALVLSGCSGSGGGSGTRLGVEIPAGEQAVALASVLEDPAGFNGKKVVMRGVVSAQCASLCEFTLLDGSDSAIIYPQGFNFPRFERGRSVTIYALVTSGEENVVFSALGVRVE